VVCGELSEVERLLAARPDAAPEPGGSRGWTPLLYLCYTRFSHPPTIANAVAIARALLDNGANPNDFYMAGDSRYTALVGAAGEGEQDSPRQPQGEELFQLLLERGAEPFDIQVLYNTHFSGEMLWWLQLIHTHTLRTGRGDAWKNPDWPMLDMGGYGPGAHFLLSVAVKKNDLQLAEWLLTHGAGPNANSSTHPKFKPKNTHYQRAATDGNTAMAELLVRYGATASEPVLDDYETFEAACFRLDRGAAMARLEEHPEYLLSHKTMFAAAARDRPDVIEFLLSFGVSIEVEDRTKQRALHQAAVNGALRSAAFLIERGAEIDPRDATYDGTPLGFAAYADKVEMVEFLSRYSRNVWTLTFRGYVDRLREVLRAEPELAKAVNQNGITPLWWLPDDEVRALEIADLLLSHSADPSLRTREGKTAADWALQRGMLEVARKLAVEPVAAPPAKPRPPELERYRGLAQDLLFAFESGHAAAMQRMQQHYGASLTWDEFRALVRRRLDAVPQSQRPPGYFALAHARLLIAREAGFENWTALTRQLTT